MRLAAWTQGILVGCCALLSSCDLKPLASPDVPSDPCASGPDWPMSGHDICNRRAQSSETSISPKSVAKLGVKWVYEAAGDVSATPAVVSGSVYVPDWGGKISRLDARTGKPVWSKSVGEVATFVDAQGKLIDGLVSRTTPVVTGTTVIFGTQRTVPQVLTDPRPNAFVVAIDAETAAIKWKRPVHDGHVAAVVTGSPVLDEGIAYVPISSLEEAFGQYVPGYACCSFRGSVIAIRVSDGSIVWQTHTITDDVFFRAGEQGKRLPSGYAGAAVWSSTPVVDRKRRSLYITTGNDYRLPAGTTGLEPGNGADSVIALDLETGAVKWSRTLIDKPDVWTFATMTGPDWDFGCGANLFTASGRDLVGAGQKSGMYWALDADTGQVVWKTKVGPGGHLGGIHWGTAVDATRIYVGNNDETKEAYTAGGTGAYAKQSIAVGSWAALDPVTGAILWQIPNPKGGLGDNGSDVNGPVTVANGVLFVGSMDPAGTMFAIDAASGQVLWSFASGGSVYGGPAIVDGVVYWGSGYPKGRLNFGTSSEKLYAFEVKP